MPEVEKYLAIKTGGYGYSFEFFGISDKSGVYLYSIPGHISVSRYKKTQANEVFSQLVGKKIDKVPDYYGDAELGNVVIDGQDLCVILRLFDGDQAHEAAFWNPHFLASSRKMKDINIEHDGVALLERIQKYLEHSLPPPLSKWEKTLDRDIVSNRSSLPEHEREEFLSDVRDNLFYELNLIVKESSVR